MKNLKKIATLLAAMTLSLTAFTACGGDTAPAPAPTEAVTEAPTEAETEPETEAETEPETEAETEDAAVADAQALIAAVSNTVWAGMDADYTCYALGFGEDEIYFGADDDSELRGYWDISMDASHIFIYSDPELTDEIGGFDWSYDEETNTMILNNTVAMAQTDADSIDAVMDELEKMGVAKAVAEGLNGTYWFGTDSSESGLVLAMFDEKMVWASIDNEGNPTVETLYWGMDYDTLTLYDANYEPVLEMGWNAAEDLSWLSLEIGGETVQMTPTTEDDAAEFIGTAVAVDEVLNG